MKKKKYNIYIVSSNYYKNISLKQIEFATKKLNELFGKDFLNIVIHNIDGSLELPFFVDYVLSKKKNIDGIITLGCLVKGKTNHFENIAKTVSEKLLELSIKYKKPITSAVVAVNRAADIRERTNGGKKDRAIEASNALYQLISSMEKV